MTTTTAKQSQQYMNQAIQLAAKGLYTTHPNPRVGCLIVKNNQIVGSGFHQQTGQSHAEVYALQEAQNEAKDADVYVTLEPCCHTGKTPPCSSALIEAGVKRVFIACLDPNPLVAGKGVKALQNAGIEVSPGILEEKAAELNKGFFKRMKTQKPFVWLKMAMSLDGKTAMASGESQWITGKEARADGQKLRARSSAILTGIGSIIHDNPSMNVRIENDLNPTIKIKQPLRIILDSQGKLSSKEKIFSLKGNILIYTNNNELKDVFKVFNEVEIVSQNTNSKHLNLQNILLDLGKREINELHIECGSKLAGAFIKAKLVDELITYIAPKLMGSNAIPLIQLPLDKMSESVELRIKSIKPVGNDIKVVSEFLID